MTALIYLLMEDTVILAMDSLSLSHDKKPFKYVTKIFPLPHLNGVMVGTGSLNLAMDWFNFIQSKVIAKDMLFLDDIAPSQLLELSEAYKTTSDMSTTIYHFGYDEGNKHFMGFAYRSTNNFNSERLIYSMGMKPDYGNIQEIGLNVIREKGIPEGLIDLINKQKRYDDELPAKDRLGIGGEIHLFIMTPKNQSLSICHRFADYDDLYSIMLDNLK
jgi:hypothetical protein